MSKYDVSQDDAPRPDTILNCSQGEVNTIGGPLIVEPDPETIQLVGDLRWGRWTIKIDGYQKWELRKKGDLPLIISKGEEFLVKIVDDSSTRYFVTNGQGWIDGKGAWVGYGRRHPDNQYSSYFDGATFFRIKNSYYGSENDDNPKKFKCHTSGQIYCEINDGAPKNNEGQLRFWLGWKD